MSIIDGKKSISDNIDSVADFLTNKTMSALGGRGLLSDSPEMSTPKESPKQPDVINDYFDKGGYTV